MVGARLPALDGDSFEVDGALFVRDYTNPSTATRLSIRKPTSLIAAYERLVRECEPTTIVELGIAGGGSTALLALLAQPERLVAIELDPHPVEGLASFIAQRGLEDRVRPHYGTNQADRAAITSIVDGEIGSTPIDLVIDDASHLLDETRASFEMLFPRVRPGGLYVIEDWAAHHHYAEGVAVTTAADALNPSPPSRPTLERLGKVLMADQPERHRPMTELLIELILARALSGDAVGEITVDGEWIVVRRGPGELDRARFRVADLYTDHFGLLSRA